VQESASIFFKGMAGSRNTIVAIEGHANSERGNLAGADLSGCVCFIDIAAARSPKPTRPTPMVRRGITGLTSDGRVTIAMPHQTGLPRRAETPGSRMKVAGRCRWMRMFRNAHWVD
jgi:phosphoribosylformylglycinamidine synthase